MNLAALTTADTAAALSVHGKHEEGRTGCLRAYLIMHRVPECLSNNAHALACPKSHCCS